MNTKAKLAGATVALLSSFAMMILLHTYGPGPFMLQPSSYGAHAYPTTAMWNQMGWVMGLGAITMTLFFGGILTLMVLLVRSIARQP